MTGVVGNKAAALVVMAIITIAAALIPLYVRRRMAGRMHLPKTQILLSGCLCFGAGVLLATVFLHLLPEARMFVENAEDKGFMPRTPYPVAELLVCVGFFLIYIVEDVVHSCVSRTSNKSREKGDVQLRKSPRHSVDGMKKTKLQEEEEDEDEDEEAATARRLMEHRASAGGHSHHGMGEGLSLLRAVVVVVAFSFHSVMEGLALGLQNEAAGVWFLFGALMSHKIFIAFCMAMELLEVGVALAPFLASMIIFSLSSPVGGLIGALVSLYSTEETAGGVLSTTILQCISAGTILYVTFCEVLERERAKPRGGSVRTITFLVGFAFMAALQVLDEASNKVIESTPLAANATGG